MKFVNCLQILVKFARKKPEVVKPCVHESSNYVDLEYFMNKTKNYMEWKLLENPSYPKIYWFRRVIIDWCEYKHASEIQFMSDYYSKCGPSDFVLNGTHYCVISARVEHENISDILSEYVNMIKQIGIYMDIPNISDDITFGEFISSFTLLSDKISVRKKEIVEQLISDFEKCDSM